MESGQRGAVADRYDGGALEPLIKQAVDCGFRRFVGESVAELKKVEWPTQSQVIQGTIVVIIACAIVGAYLYAADLVFKPLVRDLLL